MLRRPFFQARIALEEVLELLDGAEAHGRMQNLIKKSGFVSVIILFVA